MEHLVFGGVTSALTMELPAEANSRWSAFDSVTIQDYLRERFRENDFQGIEDAIKGYIATLILSGKESVDIERFLFAYLKNITNESLRLGVSLERFENYVPAVVALMQSDTPACASASLRLTEQILKHINIHRTIESNHLLNMAKEYICAHLSDPSLNLEAVSRYVGLSRVYFCKLFHQMEGVSFNVYLKQQRLEKAKQLLLTTNMKVFEVSNAVGFSHAKYFGSVFKEAVGQTPVEFQKCVHQ